MLGCLKRGQGPDYMVGVGGQWTNCMPLPIGACNYTIHYIAKNDDGFGFSIAKLRKTLYLYFKQIPESILIFQTCWD